MATIPSEALLIRPSLPSDLGAIQAIYADAVIHGTASFELVVPDADETARRRQSVLDAGWPWLVAQVRGDVVGYAYASAFRPRPAYRYSVESSIYLHPQARRLGIGRCLMAELMAKCAALGARQMLAVIGDSANHASITLHRALGFEQNALLHDVGWKFDRWLDVVIMQRRLGAGATNGPGDRS